MGYVGIVDPWEGSYLVEYLTSEIATRLFRPDEIEEHGGMSRLLKWDCLS